jgi:hypothetical protein
VDGRGGGSRPLQQLLCDCDLLLPHVALKADPAWHLVVRTPQQPCAHLQPTASAPAYIIRCRCICSLPSAVYRAAPRVSEGGGHR